MNYTRGELRVVKSNRTFYVVNDDNVLFAEVDTHLNSAFSTPTPMACEANAKLISAAPDLLEALQNIMPTLGHYEDMHITEQKKYLALEKAILKATI